MLFRSPDEGMVRGNVFIHTALNFRFEVPDGFKIENLPDKVVAKHSSGAAIVFAGALAKDVQDAGGMKGFLLNTWGAQARQSNVERLTINGMRAITATSRERVGVGLDFVDVRRILVEQNDKSYWRFQFETPSKETAGFNDALRRTTYSLRPPTQAEIADAQPTRVRVTEVGSGITVADLVDTMAVEEFKAEWFESLNGLKPEDPLTPGQKVKVLK